MFPGCAPGSGGDAGRADGQGEITHHRIAVLPTEAPTHGSVTSNYWLLEVRE